MIVLLQDDSMKVAGKIVDRGARWQGRSAEDLSCQAAISKYKVLAAFKFSGPTEMALGETRELGRNSNQTMI